MSQPAELGVMDARDSDQDYEADDSDYDYTGEESNPEEVMEEEEEPEEEERCRFNWQDEEVDQLDRGETVLSSKEYSSFLNENFTFPNTLKVGGTFILERENIKYMYKLNKQFPYRVLGGKILCL